MADIEKNLFQNQTVDSLTFEEYTKWANKDDIIDGYVLALPPIQRGFVWKPYQIQELWDSLLRGMPIGALLLQEFREAENVMGLGASGREVSGATKKGYFLIDGQQRTLSMLMGIFGTDTHKLWIDFGDDGLNGTKYRLRVTTKYQPFGYPTNGRGSLSVSDKRDAHEYYCDKHNIIEEKLFDKAKPWKAKDTEKYIYEVKELWDKNCSQFKECLDIGNDINSEIKKRIKSFFVDLNNLKKQWIPLIKVPKYKIDKNIKDDMTDPLTLLFSRISSNGTTLSSKDLLYSMIKQEWPKSHNLVNELQEKVGSLMIPTDFIMTVFRISILLQNEKNKIITDEPKPNAKYFHSHLRTLLNTEDNYGLKTLIEDGSIFIKAFSTLIDTIKFDDDNGLPKIMLPKLF